MPVLAGVIGSWDYPRSDLDRSGEWSATRRNDGAGASEIGVVGILRDAIGLWLAVHSAEAYEITWREGVRGRTVVEDDIRHVVQQFNLAVNRLQQGDAEPMFAVWSHSSDVTHMGPRGGRQQGWDQVQVLLVAGSGACPELPRPGYRRRNGRRDRGERRASIHQRHRAGAGAPGRPDAALR